MGVASNPGSWGVKDEGEVCFTNPEAGCYGKVLYDDGTPYTVKGRKNPLDSNSPGLVLESEQRLCSGDRGNTCDGDFKHKLITPEGEERLFCGSSDYNKCRDDIPEECQNNLSFNLVKDQGWCHGTLGCTKFDSKPVVYVGPKEDNYFDINLIATEQKAADENEINFHSGCTNEDINKQRRCDSDFDGVFDGRCIESGCSGDS